MFERKLKKTSQQLQPHTRGKRVHITSFKNYSKHALGTETSFLVPLSVSYRGGYMNLFSSENSIVGNKIKTKQNFFLP